MIKVLVGQNPRLGRMQPDNQLIDADSMYLCNTRHKHVLSVNPQQVWKQRIRIICDYGRNNL